MYDSGSPSSTDPPPISTENLYRKFFDSFEDEMYLHDEHGRLLDVNVAACESLGYLKSELIGMSIEEISAQVSFPSLLDAWKDMAVGSNSVANNCHRRKDGSVYYLDVYINCQEVEGKKYFLAAARRNEEKRQREDEIVQLNRRLRALVDERTRQWQESSRLLNAVTEQTPDAIFIKDQQGRYQYVNQALSRQLGMPVENILGRTDCELYPDAQAQDFLRTDEEVLQSQQTRVYEARMHSGSQVVFANTMKTPYRDEQGRIAGVLGITRDVTEMRYAQEQTAHNYEMLRQAERIARIGSWTLDLATSTFSASEMLTSMNGLAPDDPPLTPETLASMIPSDQHAALSVAIGQCIEKGTPYTIDVQHKHPHGGHFPARIRGQAYRDPGGKIIMLHGTLQDLSEHVEADQRLQTLADNVPNGAIFRCEQTAQGRLVLHYVSAGIQHLLGRPAQTFLSGQHDFTHHILPEDKPQFFSQLKQSIKTGEPFDLIFRMLQEGSTGVRRMRARAVLRRTHHAQLWEGILLDVTTEYEVQENLRQAKEAAETAERAKSEFLATMSHEIRTPMNTVIGMTQLLQQTPLSSKQRNYLDKVHVSAAALLSIINDILDFSKLEAEMLHTTCEPFALESLLESVASVTGLRAEQKGVEIIYNIDANVPRHLFGDVQHLGQILTNLVGNAIKFTDRGEVLISIKASAHASDVQTKARNCTLQVSVRDTGIGIEPQHMATLFQPFTQAEAHTSRRYGGTGLGLAICYKLVKLMGGDIQAYSTVGQGSEFVFQVTLQVSPQEPEAKSLPLHACRVLVVDDNAMAQEVLGHMVNSFGLACDTSSSGAQALAMLEQASTQGQPYHLVLMDWQMPEMDGLTLAQHIRNHPQLSATPAMLMVTAYYRDEVIARITQLDLQGLLVKPVTESVLFNSIQDALHAVGTHYPAPPASGHGPGRLQTPALLQGKRILVVDDNALNREVAQDFLELAGVQVTTAASGQEALQWMQRKVFDAVLLDIQMPEMDGLEVARRIRAQAQFQTLPIWALSAQARPEEKQATMASGMNGHITKPIDAPLLYQTLAQALTPHHSEGHASPAPAAASDILLAPQSGITRHFGGQQERVQRLLRAFVRDFSDAPQRLVQLHVQQDHAALTMLAHTLKGALGYLDYPQATQAMAQLEAHGQQGQLADPAGVAAAAAHLQQVLAAIRQQLPETPSALAKTSSMPATTLDMQQQSQVLEHIQKALAPIRRGDYAGLRLLEQVEHALRGSPLHGLAARALALAEDLETDAACECLVRLQQALQPMPGTPATGACPASSSLGRP